MSAVDLSSVNRATLSAKEGYGWIHVLALIYCVVIGLFSVAAWLGDGEPFRAAVCAGAQVLSVIMALLARRGFTGQMKVSGLVGVAIAFGFAMWAAEGLQHAWSANGADIEEWQVWFLTGSEPAIFLLIEHIKEGREALRAAQEKADREAKELAAELARIRERESPVNRQMVERPADRPVEPPVARLKLVETARLPDESPGIARQVVDGLAVAGVSAGGSTGLPVELVDVSPAQPLTVPAHSEATWASPEAHAEHLIKQEGVRHRNELARRVRGLTTYRAAQLLDQFSPGWRTKAA